MGRAGTPSRRPRDARPCPRPGPRSYVEIYNEELRDLLDRDGDGKPDSLGYAAEAGGAGAPAAPTLASSASRSTSVPAGAAGKGKDKDKEEDPEAARKRAAIAAATGPRIRELPSGEIVMDGVTRHVVRSFEALSVLLDDGGKRRTVAATQMNATSSRSHGIVTLYLNMIDTDAADGDETRRAKLHLVDLAGSERADSTGAAGDRLKEGAAINQSLSALGNVINALVERGPGGKGYIPYRDSRCVARVIDRGERSRARASALAAPLAPAG